MAYKIIPVIIISLGLIFNLLFYSVKLDTYLNMFDNDEYHEINYLLTFINENQLEIDSLAIKSTIKLNLIGYNIFRDEYIVEMSRIYGFDIDLSDVLQNKHGNYEIEEKTFNKIVNQIKSSIGNHINFILIYRTKYSKIYVERFKREKI